MNAQTFLLGQSCLVDSNNQIQTDNCQIVRFDIQNLNFPLNSDLSSQNITHLSGYFAFALTSVLFFWLFSLGIGQILKLIKNA